MPDKQPIKSFYRKDQFLNYLFLVFFMLSGAAALMYEIVWIRQFSQVLGASGYAVTVILAAFMAGLGLGAWFWGKKADHCKTYQLIKIYILLEIGIGVYAIVLPFILGYMENIYVWFYVLESNILNFNIIKFVLSFFLLVVPATFIGGTLPILSRFIIRRKLKISFKISHLYAVNTIGAILGTLTAGYIFLPNLGIKATTSIAVAVNFLVAAGFWLANRVNKYNIDSVFTEPVKIKIAKQKSASYQNAVVAGFFLSGVSAMLYEVAWTRTLQMILGTTTFAFTTMLVAFLAGIALGSLMYNRIKHIVSGTKLFALLQLVIAFSVLLTIPLFDKLPFLFISLDELWINTWMDMQFFRFFLAASIMGIPTLAMGILLPTVSSIFIEETGHLGKRLGNLYGLNTLGNVIGALLAGFLFVQTIGMQKTIILGALLNFTAGAMVYIRRTDITLRNRCFKLALSCTAIFLLILLIKPWSPMIINSGVYVYANKYQKMIHRYQYTMDQTKEIPDIGSWEIMEAAMKQYQLLYYNPGIVSTVAVMQRDDGVRFLTVDGKTDASTGEKSDMNTQVMIGQLPMLFHDDPDKVLIVGLGSGVTAGSVLTHDVRVVDCAEISPSVVEAAQFFSDANHNALMDRRLKVKPRDARNLLLTSDEKYDVIISQPSNPWISGESALFSLEWYKQVYQHLNKKGMFLQWVPSYLMAKRDLKIIIHTLQSVFPNLTLWTSGSVGDLILIASKGGPLLVDYKKFLKKIKNHDIKNDIVRLGLNPNLIPFNLFVMNQKELNSYLYANLEKPLQKNTDDLPITEFTTPKQLIYNRKVKGLIDPEDLHGKMSSLNKILINFNKADLQYIKEIKQETGKTDI